MNRIFCPPLSHCGRCRGNTYGTAGSKNARRKLYHDMNSPIVSEFSMTSAFLGLKVFTKKNGSILYQFFIVWSSFMKNFFHSKYNIVLLIFSLVLFVLYYYF